MSEARNFKNTCVRKLEKLPKEPCLKGKPNFNEKKNLQEKKKLCPWYIDSEEHNYCFWKYINDMSDEQSRMPDLCYREIGKFLGISSSTVGITVRDCLNILKNSEECKDINQLMTTEDPRIDYVDFLTTLESLADQDSDNNNSK